MNDYNFINNDVYLGDRYLDDIVFNYNDGEVGFKFNNIGCIEGASWASERDGISGGVIFVSKTTKVHFNPHVCIPNEGIDSLEVRKQGDGLLVEMVTSFTSENLTSHKVVITIYGSEVYIYDPNIDSKIRG
jgi:hypothetical protein